jgi:hypothetical protein
MRPALSHRGERLRKGAVQAGGLVAAKAADLQPLTDIRTPHDQTRPQELLKAFEFHPVMLCLAGSQHHTQGRLLAETLPMRGTIAASKLTTAA